MKQELLYTPYGDTFIDLGSADIERYFTGQIKDKDSGLYYMNNRYYDAELGTFNRPDPVMSGVNHYGYVSGNPVMYSDPTGLEEKYIIEKDDTLTKIANKFGTTVDALVERNNIEDPNYIREGDPLMIPDSDPESGTGDDGEAGPVAAPEPEARERDDDKMPLILPMPDFNFEPVVNPVIDTCPDYYYTNQQEGVLVKTIARAIIKYFPLIMKAFGKAIKKILFTYLDLIGKLQASPNTLIGIIAGVIITAIFGGKVVIANNAISFITDWDGPGAITLGNVIIYADRDNFGNPWNPNTTEWRYDKSGTINLGKHEEAHTYQQQLLGIFFWILYPIMGGADAKNPIEKAADDYADTDVNGKWWKIW